MVNVAEGLAVHALVRFVLGAVAVFNGLPLFHHDDFMATSALLDHFQSGEDTGWGRRRQ